MTQLNWWLLGITILTAIIFSVVIYWSVRKKKEEKAKKQKSGPSTPPTPTPTTPPKPEPAKTGGSNKVSGLWGKVKAGALLTLKFAVVTAAMLAGVMLIYRQKERFGATEYYANTPANNGRTIINKGTVTIHTTGVWVRVPFRRENYQYIDIQSVGDSQTTMEVRDANKPSVVTPFGIGQTVARNDINDYELRATGPIINGPLVYRVVVSE